MKIYLIRHGLTAGNLEKRYVGCHTDEPLCEEGILEIREKEYPEADRVYTSPMKRCIMTAQMIYPDMPLHIKDNLKEMDFGEFEYHNYKELNGNEEYQKWIDSGGELPFPNGESKAEFSRRCVEEFQSCIRECRDTDRVAFVVHGGTIMAIMEVYGVPRGEYYRWQIPNAQYVTLELID